MTDFRPREDGVVYIGAGVRVTGVIQAQETVVIDGEVDGDIACRMLLVGAGGRVTGEANAQDADIFGGLNAHLVVRRLLVARDSARIEGDWTSSEIVAERGAILNGAGVTAAAEPTERDRAPVTVAPPVLEAPRPLLRRIGGRPERSR